MAVWKKRNRRFLTSKAQKGRRNPTKSRGASIHEESNAHSRYERTRAGRVNERPCHLSLFISTSSFTHISNPVLPHSFETMKMVVVREEVCGTEKGATGTYSLWRRRRTAKDALKKLIASNVRGRREGVIEPKRRRRRWESRLFGRETEEEEQAGFPPPPLLSFS